MTSAASTRPDAPRSPAVPRGLLIVVVLAAGTVGGVLAVFSPLLALAFLVLVILGLSALRSPELATFAVVFILFSNLAVVATRFHGVPRLVAGSFLLLLGVPLLRDLVVRRERLIVTPALPFLILVLCVQLLGTAFSRDFVATRTVVAEFLLEGFLVYVLITNAVRTPRSLRLAVWALLLAGFVSAVVPCYQQLTGSFDSDFGGLGQVSEVGFRTGEITSHGEARQRRLSGTVGEQNRYAQNMLMLLPLGLFLFLNQRSTRWRLVALLLVGFTGVGFLLAFSRGAAVGFLIVIVAMAALRVVTLRQLSVVALLAVLALVAVPQYRARLTTMKDVTALFSETGLKAGEFDSAMERRVTEMIAAAKVFVDNPVIGVGPGMFKYYSQEYGNRLGIREITETRKAHSLYLEVAAEGGSLGLICFGGFVLMTLNGLLVARRRLLRVPSVATPEDERERLELARTVTGFLLALVAYLATALFLHLAYIRFFYLMVALAASASGIAVSRFGSTPTSTPPPPDPGTSQGRA